MANGMHHTQNGMAEKVREQSISLLNQTLADAIDLYTETKQAHWNLKGHGFIAIHKLLDEVAEEVEEHIDIIAERITALGGTAYGTVQCVAKSSKLRAYPTDITSVTQHLEHLTHNYAILGEFTRANIHKTEEIGDFGTNDLYIAFVRLLDHKLWLLEAQLQK
jgi:starvation-inducible DNA-binding protein